MQQADVLLAQQAGGEDFGRYIAAELVLLVHFQGGAGAKRFVVQTDVGDASHHHAGHLHRRFDFQPTNIVELGVQRIGAIAPAAHGQIGGFQRQKQHGGAAQRGKNAHP